MLLLLPLVIFCEKSTAFALVAAQVRSTTNLYRALLTGSMFRIECCVGTNFYGVVLLLSEMRRKGESGSVVSLIADGGDRYSESYYSASVRCCPRFLC
jgi:hypothetical protein